MANPDAPTRRHEGLRGADYLLLTIGAVYWPVHIMARHLVGIVHPERLVLLMVVTWLVVFGFAWGLVRMGFRRSTVTYSTFVAVVMLMSGGRIIRLLGNLTGWAVIALTVALAVIVFIRFGDRGPIKPVMVAFAVALLSGIGISGFRALQEWGSETVEAVPDLEVELTDRPDIFVVVLDGYPGFRALEMDTGDSGEQWKSTLRSAGFSVPESAWAPYWSTKLSVPSLLNMDYPLTEEEGGFANTNRLYEMIGGDNALVRILEDNGYASTMIESGWSGGGCGPEYDTCIASPFLDEAVFFTLWDTVAGPYVTRAVGNPFTVGTRSTIDWLLDNAAEISASGEPEFVFGHLVAPHPPFFLDENCDVVLTAQRAGVHFYEEGTEKAARERYFAGQKECVDDFVLRLAGAVEPDDVLLFFGDHGTDRRLQLEVTAEEWDDEAVVERLNVFAAVRTGESCAIDDSIVLPNLTAQVLSCLSTPEIPEVANRMWMNSMVEIERDKVEVLVSGDELQLEG